MDEFSEICYKIYLCYDEKGKRNDLYRLMEEDEWDESHLVEMLNNATLIQILMFLDILGCRDKLKGLKNWEEQV